MSETEERSGSGRAPMVLGVLAVLAGVATLALAWLAIQRIRARPEEGWAPLLICVIPAFLAAAFGFFSFVLAAAARTDRVIAERRAVNPDQPWLWKDEWREGRIQGPDYRRRGRFFLGLGAFFLAGFIALVLGQRPQVAQGVWGVGLVGLSLIVVAGYYFQAARKYPSSVFEMSVLPGRLGGPLTGSVRVPPQLPGGSEARVALSCETVPTSSSHDRTTLCVWQDETHVRVSSAGSLPIDLTIPFDLPPSELPGSTEGTRRIEWRLRVSARVPGIDYRADFQVPVFATPASDASIRKGAVDPSHPTERPANAKSAIVEWGGETTAFALGRAKGLGCGVIAFVLLPLLGWAFGHYGDYLREDAVGFVTIGLVAGTVILALGCVAVLVTATRLEIDGDAIRVQHGTWLLRWRRTIPLADVAKIEVDSSNVQLVNALTKDGKSYWISGTLSGPQEAKWFATEVARALERHRGPTGRGPGVRVS